MILTVTVNAAVDKTLTVPNLQLGHRHRAQQGIVIPGGKGVNVARALKRLGEPVIATGLAGGRTGSHILDGMTEEGILNDFVRIRGESRTSTVVVDPTSGVQTEIYEYGPEVSEDELATLREKLQYLAPSVSAVVFAGSLPRRVPTDLYAEMVAELTRRKVRTVVDCDGEPLRRTLSAQPGVVSTEQREAESLVGHEFQTDEDFQDALSEIASMGAGGVLITLRTGCYALLRSGRGRAHMYRAWIAQVESVSSVGSGEALLAGFVAAQRAELGHEECLRRALACGAANSQTVGAGVFDPRDVPRFAGMVEVEEIRRAGTRAAL